MPSDQASAPARGLLTVPAPLRALFQLFPLRTYDPDALPYRSPDRTPPRPVLHIFALDEGDCLAHKPSYNPSCLKWQTFLRIAGVDVDLVPSNNHASPSGALPFLLPGASDGQAAAGTPLTGERMVDYARRHASYDPPSTIPNHRLEVYRSLIAQAIRPAWLHALYLHPSNAPLLARLYLPASPLIALPTRHTLLEASTAEILRTTRRPLLLPDTLYADAADAFRALGTLLGDGDGDGNDWFFGADGPGLFDAEVFAYTWLILDDALGWRSTELRDALAAVPNLVAHRERLYRRYWPQEDDFIPL